MNDLIWLMAYAILGLLTFSVSMIHDPEGLIVGEASSPTRVMDSYIWLAACVLLWPLGWVIVFFDFMKGLLNNLLLASKNTAAVKELERLKEENEALKDRLYEMEP